VALGWLVGAPLLAAPAIFGAVAWLARAERDRQVAAAADSLAPGLRVDYLAAESDTYFVLASSDVLVILAIFLVPPAALCLAWLAGRRRRLAA
jgi:hypothetical protein